MPIEKVAVNINSLQINNVYKENFQGNIPYPTAEWMEMSYIEDEDY